ncbi:MAG: BcpO-related WXXGXW repeat protein [Chlorobiaceae bacterium]|nr:BcpO-related WXXGXW repeat protein [Chlorobiaceae bacterium]
MKKSIWLAAGVAGMLLGNPATEAKGAVSVLINARDGHSFVLESRPSFIMLPEKGFSVAVGSPYDIVFYDNRYYLNQNGSWYRSSNYRGPWTFIKAKHLPSRIRRHRLDEIRSFRDTEYRRHDQRNNLEQQRRDENNRRVLEQQRSDENNRRTLEQQRSDENNRRVLEQQRSDENNRRTLEQQRNDQNRR